MTGVWPRLSEADRCRGGPPAYAVDMSSYARYHDINGSGKTTASDESPGKTAEGTMRIQTADTVTSSGSVRVRLIQQSPTANPRLVEAARKFAQRSKEKEGEEEETLIKFQRLH